MNAFKAYLVGIMGTCAVVFFLTVGWMIAESLLKQEVTNGIRFSRCSNMHTRLQFSTYCSVCVHSKENLLEGVGFFSAILLYILSHPYTSL